MLRSREAREAPGCEDWLSHTSGEGWVMVGGYGAGGDRFHERGGSGQVWWPGDGKAPTSLDGSAGTSWECRVRRQRGACAGC